MRVWFKELRPPSSTTFPNFAAMKAMKALTKPKALKAKPEISARLAKRLVWAGKLAKTAGGLSKADLIKNKHGKIVSKKLSQRGHKCGWMVCCIAARWELNIKGFAAIKKKTHLYERAKEFYKDWTPLCFD